MDTSQQSDHTMNAADAVLAEYQHGFELSGARVCPADGTVSNADTSIKLEPRIMQVLTLLAARQGEVVSRDEILDRVWGQTPVTDDAIARCIYQLRQALPPLLGSDAPQEMIETLRKLGYRLNVQARPITGKSAPTARSKATRATVALPIAGVLLIVLAATGWWFNRAQNFSSISSIAVLPFDNMTGDENFQYLADGFSEQLSHDLANVPNLRVAARTSAFYFKDRNDAIPTIAEKLGVKSLIEGSIRRDGGVLRVTVQFVRDDGFHIWSKEFDRPADDFLRLQSDVARAVLAELTPDPPINPRQRSDPTSNFAAYDLYLRGRHELRKGDADRYARAIELFRQAIALDSGYALAYAGLADAYSLSSSAPDGSRDSLRATIDGAVSKALELDDQLPEAHASRGLQRFVETEYNEAEIHLRRAVALNPNDARGHFLLGLTLVYLDRFDEAIETYKLAQRLNPMDAALNRNLGANLLLLGRPEEGFSYLERAVQTAPDDQGAYFILAAWSTIYGRLPGAIDWADEGLQRFPDSVQLLTQKGVAQLQLGRWDEARKNLLRSYTLDPEDDTTLQSLFYLYLGSGDMPAMDALLISQGAGPEPDWADIVGDRGAFLGRWMVIRRRLAGAPADAVSVGRQLEAKTLLECQQFGESGTQLYLAQALILTANDRSAQRHLGVCLQDVDRIRVAGGTYPRTLYRMAVTLALAGETENAARRFREAVDLGWRAYWQAWNDPLWQTRKTQSPFAEIFQTVKSDLDRQNSATP